MSLSVSWLGGLCWLLGLCDCKLGVGFGAGFVCFFVGGLFVSCFWVVWVLDFFFLVISICTELLCFGRGFLIEYSLIIKRPVRDAYLFSPKFD